MPPATLAPQVTTPPAWGAEPVFIKPLPKPDIEQDFIIPLKAVQAKEAAEAVVEPVRATVSLPVISITISGNGYTWGQCTWFVKSRLPQLPNNLGNARNWGFVLGYDSNPTIGAIAWTTAGWAGHVAIVVANSGGQTLIEEANGPGGVGVIDQRWIPTSSYHYIHI